MQNIGIIGAGTMGNGIAHVSSLSGFDVTLIDINDELLDRGLAAIKKNMQRQIQKNKISDKDMESALKKIRAATDMNVLKSSDIIIEAATENLDIKKSIFKLINNICNSSTILATNTSSISINAIASVTNYPYKVIGMHFMNPVPLMRLVEVIRGADTDKYTEDSVMDLARAMGKIPVVCNDSPGFVANRILIPMINEAIFTYQEGVAEAADIDQIITLGMNHPMGPLKLADLIGLDVVLYIANILYNDFKDEKYRPCSLLNEMVNKGDLGVKTGNGFYNYQ